MMSKTNKPKLEQKDRLKEYYLETIRSGSILVDDIESMDFFNALYKAKAEEKVYLMFNCHFCMFKYKFGGKDSILIIFSIPYPSNPEAKEDGRHISQKIMELVKVIEDCFIKVDYMNVRDIKENKFSYLVVVKNYEDENDEN